MIIAIAMVVIALFYHRASLLIWTIALTLCYVFFLGWFGFFWPSTVIYFTTLAILLFLQIKPFRRQYLTSAIFKKYRQMVPSMSQTEREAIDAGTVSWEGELFKGNPDWQKFLNLPVCKLSEEEKDFLQGPVETLCLMLNDWEITHERLDLPKPVWDYLKTNGFFGLVIPKEYGGKGFSAYAHSQILMKVSGISVTAAVTISVPNSLGPAELLLHYGTDKQRQYYLPRLAKGEEIPCFALTSEDAGSDASAMTDYGIVIKGEFEGKNILGIRLHLHKRYITLAPIATVIGLAFKLYDPDHLISEKEELGITCALIPRETPGLTIGRRHFPLNCPFQNGPIHGDNVFIPLDWIIGGIEHAGKGWRMLMECLAAGRAITLPGTTTGGSKLLTLATSAYARVRTQFGLPICQFEGIQEPLAYIAGYTYLMNATRKFTVASVDAGEKPAIASAISKYHITELSRTAVIHSMDIHGGKGICLGPKNYLARGFESSPIAVTVEGANILTRNLIIFGQGVIRCHPYLLAEMKTVESDEKEGLKVFDHVFVKHTGFILSNIIRTFILSLTGARFVSVPNIALKRYLQQITRFSSAFALLVDLCLMIYGSSLKRKETISARLGDILSHLYMLSAVVKFYQDEGDEEEKPIALFACQYCLCKVQESFNDILRNFKNRFVGSLLQFLIFPFGNRALKASDELMVKVTNLITKQSLARKNLGKDTCESYPIIAELEEAMKKAIEVEPIEKKLKSNFISKLAFHDYHKFLQQAVSDNIITQEEQSALVGAYKAKIKVIKVDDFTNEELLGR